MKTIQQVLKELDHEEIERAFFREYQTDVRELKDRDDMSIGEYKKMASERFQGFIDRLCAAEINPNPEGQGILFIHKAFDRGSGQEYYIRLVMKEELMMEEELSKVESYAYDLESWDTALGFLVADTKLTQDNLMDLAVDFLWEMSWFGYEPQDIENARKDLEEKIREADERRIKPEEMNANHFEEKLKEYEIPIEEEYPKERELKDVISKAEEELTDYCRCIELERIKEGIKNGQR